MIFERNRKKGETGKSGMFGFLRRSEGHIRCGVALRLNVGLPDRGKVEGPKSTPRPSGTLRRGVGTVHRGKFFGFCFESLVFIHR